jgi:Cu(I)/Ag(I) efflux system membrane fusion protein
MSHFHFPHSRRIAAIVVALVFLSAGCSRPAHDALPAATAPTTAKQSAADAAAAQPVYVCPMHPHIRQHGSGQCPICGMALVLQEGAVEPASPATTAPAANGTMPVSPSAPGAGDRKILYYYDPMRPDVHFERPGPSPFMDMDLVPKYAEAQAATGVRVDPALLQSLGIRTATPTRREVRPRVRVPARVVADAQGQARLQARVSGWIEQLQLRAPGQSVVAGSVIAELYSPELVQAQEELLLGGDTAAGAAERLRRLGIADIDIQAVRHSGQARRRLPVRAPASGVVTELGVREGSRVSPDTLIADVSARSAVWVEAQVFPAQKLLLGEDVEATFTLPGLPDRRWRANHGRPVPVADATTQTLPIRFALDNRDALPLGTQLDAELRGTPREDVLLAPASAIIRKANGAWVLVERSPNRFAPVAVQLGPRYDDGIEIREGLAIDDRIVISGQFLLDAEADLQAGLTGLAAAADAAPQP